MNVRISTAATVVFLGAFSAASHAATLEESPVVKAKSD
jgi:hypothetical protein